MMHACYCADVTCSQFGCKQFRGSRGAVDNAFWNAPPPRGCICPPGSEKTCEGTGCPRQNPLAGARKD
jgi:hypothetical protein